MAVVGQVIDEKYEILTLIGQGGMSKVYLARDKRLNKQWAVKEIQKKVRDRNNEVVVQSAIMEANMIKRLDHASIVRIVDIIENPDEIYIIEDYIEGETLDRILEENGAQPQELVIEWGMQICEAFEYLHTRKPPIIYRDMKPANVMLRPDGNIKIIDFGIAREYKEQNSSDTVNLGTKGYAAPEQFGNRGQTDARTDIYCLGATLYHLVTGHSPCEPPSYEIYPIRHWNPRLDPGLEAIIEKCVQINPDDRFQSCAELLYALQHYEENGEAYREKQKKKLGIFITASAACIVSAFIGILGLAMRTVTNNADYEQNITRAESATSSEEKIDYYVRAIEIKPLENEAYLKMIEEFEKDAVFSEDEEQILANTLKKNQKNLKDENEYADLAFEAGRLYWYYYGYGNSDGKDMAEEEETDAVEGDDNEMVRMAAARSWFADAVEYGDEATENYTIAAVYRDIGEFMENSPKKVKDGTDGGTYAPFWENIKELVAMISVSKNEREIHKLEIYRFAIYKIETYAKKFRSEGVEKKDIQEVFDTVKEEVSAISTTTDKTETMKNKLSGRMDKVQEAIDNAYRESR